MKTLNYWLWLTLKDGFGSVSVTKLLEVFETPEAVYHANENELKAKTDFRGAELKALLDKDLTPVRKVKEACVKHNIKILTYDSSSYPEKLRTLYDPPYVLYVKSKQKILLNDKLCIAMVGNRVMTDYGRTIALDFAKGFANAGVVVVSGLARGIDGASHVGTLRANGITVAVLGCGPDIAYPPEHDELMETIAETGMVLSEYPPGTPPLPQNFPRRNRIISGLCDGVVVVEAPKVSGALITAEYAYNQGRDVFAVPGDITRGHSRGTLNLIRDGATLVTSYLDVLSEYEQLYINTLKQYINTDEEEYKEEKTEITIPDDGRYDGLSETSKTIVRKLSLTPVHFDKLLIETNLSADALSAELMMLEIGGFIKTLPGKNFVLNV